MFNLTMPPKILGARRLELLSALKSDLESRFGVTVTVGVLDVADGASADAFFKGLPEELRDNVDVLVNNAGVAAIPGPVYETDDAGLDKIINTNVKGVVKMIRLFVPGMLKRQSGHIINVSSIVGKESVPTLSIYSGSKHFVEAINTALRSELVATPLRVTLISPGATESEFITSVVGAEFGALFHAGYKPLDSADIAEDIVYAASRPLHVQVQDIVTTPSAQADAHTTHRAAVNGGPALSMAELTASLKEKSS